MSIDLKCGNCMDIMRSMGDNSVNCIVTSPPYNKHGLSGDKKTGNQIWQNFNINYNAYADDMNETDYAKWQIDFLNECGRIIKQDGSIFYNHKVRRFQNSAHFPKWVFSTNLNLYQFIIWNRVTCYDMRNDYLYPTTELLFWFTKDKPKVHKDKAAYKSEIWDIIPNKSNGHPASFPVELSDNCILLTTDEGDTVLDPFMGSGTTGVSCKKLHRDFIGIDIDPVYYDMSKSRIETTTFPISLF